MPLSLNSRTDLPESKIFEREACIITRPMSVLIVPKMVVWLWDLAREAFMAAWHNAVVYINREKLKINISKNLKFKKRSTCYLYLCGYRAFSGFLFPTKAFK